MKMFMKLRIRTKRLRRVNSGVNSGVLEALGKYWRKKKKATTGHWIRTSSNIQSYTVSKAVDSEVNKPPSLPFMV